MEASKCSVSKGLVSLNVVFFQFPFQSQYNEEPPWSTNRPPYAVEAQHNAAYYSIQVSIY